MDTLSFRACTFTNLFQRIYHLNKAALSDPDGGGGGGGTNGIVGTLSGLGCGLPEETIGRVRAVLEDD